MEESQSGVARWADETFGTSTSNMRIAARANEEMAELLRALSTDDNNPKALEEIADVFIVLYRVAERLGGNIYDEIDRKMEINRQRVWQKDGSGHGYHVKSK